MTSRRPPSSGDDRALTGRRVRTPPTGVPADAEVVDPLGRTVEDMVADEDALTPPPVMVAELRHQLQSRGHINVEQLEMAEVIAERVMQSVQHMHRLQSNRLMQVAQAAPGSELTHKRIAELETFRDEFRQWRLGLTGVDERNGRLGRMDQALKDQRCDLEDEIAQLRKDVGTSEEAATVRAVAGAVKAIKARTWAAIAAAVVAVGGGSYGVITRDEARDAAVRADARIQVRLEIFEQGLQRLVERVDRLVGRRSPSSDSDQPTRNP